MRLGLAVAWVLALAPHPLHLGLLELNWRSAEGRLEVMIKLFRHDVADALTRYHGRRFAADLSNAQPADLVAYFDSRLQLATNGRPLKLAYVGREAADDAEWFYFEADCPRPLPLRVDNRLLFELFADQDHFVHYTEDGRNRRSFRLNARRPQVLVE